MIDFSGFDARLLSRMQELLASSSGQLPVRFVAAKVRRLVTDSPIEVIVESVQKTEGLFNCSKVFGGIQDKLNAEFAGDPAYQPISLLVPLEFLGRNPVLEVLEREADIRTYQSVRLRKENNG